METRLNIIIKKKITPGNELIYSDTAFIINLSVESGLDLNCPAIISKTLDISFMLIFFIDSCISLKISDNGT